MAQTAHAKIVVLWDNQLVAAAKALELAVIAEKDEIKTEKERAQLWSEAMNACYAALYSKELAGGGQVCVLSAKRAVAESEKV